MSYTDNPLNDENQVDTTQKWDEPFRELLDDIFYPGYADNLAEENPVAYNTEYYYFLAVYD